jgi:hypothetical protein
MRVEGREKVREKIPLLAETAGHIGDVQVRNMGTIGGSVAHADPAALRRRSGVLAVCRGGQVQRVDRQHG